MTTKETPRRDPAEVAAIEATLMLAVYQAQRKARRQLAGLDPVPTPSDEAMRLHRNGTLVR